jgi:UDP-N-acetylglucosamine 4,6-dehydratase
MTYSKRILIIGGSGSLGHTLTKRYINSNEIFIFSRGEDTQWKMKQTFGNDKNLSFFVGDIRDCERVETCIFRSKPHIIIIAAALKHIDICEKNVDECINTNINGVRNVINIITKHALRDNIPFLETVLFVSTDKACSPINTYGLCKSISERIMIEKSEFIQKPKFINVRYGNVLQSRGSLIPLFKSIGENKEKKHFTVTNKDMTRFFMSLEDSVDLIDNAIIHGESGDTIIPKNISSYRIMDIAEYFSKKYDKPISVMGCRSGEKLHETLISSTESLRTELLNHYYVIKPTFYRIYIEKVSFCGKDFDSLHSVSTELDEPMLEAINN